MSLLKTQVLSRTLFKKSLIDPMYINCMKNIRKQQLIRSVTTEHVTRLDEETLVGRLLIYLNDNKIVESYKSEEILNVVRGIDEKKMKHFNLNNVLSTLTSFSNYETNDAYKFSKMLNMLDDEFCKRLNDLKVEDILNVLHMYMKIIPHKIVQYKYYKMAVEELFIKLDVLDKNSLIQLIFFIGLQKKGSNSRYMLRKCINTIIKNFLNDLTTEELCIVCNSCFKTSTKINNELLLNKIINHLNDNLYICKDPALLITFIKTVRHNRYQNEDLLVTLSCTFFFNKTIKYYSFAALCHILALYSDFFYYDENLTKVFMEKCIEQLKDSGYSSKHTYMKDQPRMKDVKRFLWCLSNLNYRYLTPSDIKDVIIPNVMKRIQAGECKDDAATPVEIMLYLWILNYNAYELVPYVLTKENIQIIKAASKSPGKHRLNLLLSCIYFEDKPLYRKVHNFPPENTKYNLRMELRKRPLLQKILKNLNLLTIHSDINKYEVNFQIPHLKIAGITGYKRNIYNTVYIELLDEYTSLKNTDQMPNGLMQLKLRILENLEQELIVIRSSEIELLTDKELRNFLLDELNSLY